MWTTKNRGRYDRDRLRYPSDLTDEEWKLVEPLIPPAKRGGDKRTVDIREVVNALMYGSVHGLSVAKRTDARRESPPHSESTIFDLDHPFSRRAL